MAQATEPKTPDQKFEQWWKAQREKSPIIEECATGELYGALVKILEPLRVLTGLLNAKVAESEGLAAILHDVLNEREARRWALYCERGRKSLKTHLPEVPQEIVEVILQEMLFGQSSQITDRTVQVYIGAGSDDEARVAQ